MTHPHPRRRLLGLLVAGIAAVIALGWVLLLEPFAPRDASDGLRAADDRGRVAGEPAPHEDRDATPGDAADAPRIVRLRGRVVDELGRPVPEATVSARRHIATIREIDVLALARHATEAPRDLETTVSDDAGVFELVEIPDGAYVICAVAEGFAPGSVEGAVASAKELPPEIEVRLGRGHPVEGLVVDAEQLPIEGAYVAIDRGARAMTGFQTRQATRTGEDGRFRFPAVRQADDYVLNVRAEGYGRAVRPELRIPARRAIVVRLAGRAVLTGRVRDEHGVPVAGASVLAASGLPILSYDVTRTAPDGSYRLENLGAGNVLMITVTKAGYAPYPEGPLGSGSRPSLTLQSGATERFDVTLRRGAVLVGTVRSADGAPVPNASVRVISGQVSMLSPEGALLATTEEDGSFRLTGLSVGRNVVTASRDGFTQEISPQELAAAMRPGSSGGATPNVVHVQPDDHEVSIDIVLQEAATITGRVVDPEGRPVAGATVGLGTPEQAMSSFQRMMDLTGGSSTETRSDANGRFTLAPVHAGEAIRVFAAADGFSPAVADALPLAPGETIEGVELRLKAGAMVSGVVMTEDGAPIPGARVRAAPVNLEWSLTWGEGDPNPVTTDDQGRFEKAVPLTGNIVIRADAEGYASATVRNVELTPGEGITGVEVTMPASLRVGGVVIGPDGEPAGEVSVRARAQDRSGGVRFERLETVTGADGRFVIDGLRPGPYRIRARSSIAPEEEVRDVPAGTMDVSIKLEPGLRISGQLVGPSGEPVGGVSVRARRNGRGSAGVRTNASGEFVFDNLEAGTWNLHYDPEPTDPGSYLAEELADVSAGSTSVVMRLRAGWSVGGVVVDARGTPVPNASVGLLQGKERRSSSTDLEGRFLFRGLPAGEWKVTASSLQGLAGSREGVESGATDVVLRLEAAVRIEGRVVLAGNRPPGISLLVAAVPEGEERAVAVATCGEDGRFVLENLPPGRYALRCSDSSRGLTGVAKAMPGQPVTIVLK